jgi:hypothetical protein
VLLVSLTTLTWPFVCCRFGVKEKLQLTLGLPPAFGVMIAAYVGIKLLSARRQPLQNFKADHQGRTPMEAVTKQVVTLVVGGFMFGSVFFLRNVLIPWNCTPPDDEGREFIRAQPDTPCDLDDDNYVLIYALAWTGLVAYLGMFGAFTFFLFAHREWFDFIGDKFDDEFFYWELLLLVRKLLIMVAFMFFADSTEKSWFVGASVVIVSLLFHVAAAPFEDPLIDWCEFFSLVATLFICMSGIVFKLLNDPASPQQTVEAEALSRALEIFSVCLMFGTCVLTVIVEFHTYRNVTDATEGDYKVKMLDKHLEAARADLKEKKGLMAQAEANAVEAEGHKNGRVGDEAKFNNPLVAFDDVDAQPSSGKTRKKRKE